MKRILLLLLPDPRFPNPSDPGYEGNRLDYRLTIEQCVRLPLDRQQGATIDEMRKGIRILDALDRAIGDAPLELEDADWTFLKQKLEKYPWAGTDRRFVRFYDDIMEATDAVRDPTRTDGVAAT